MKPTSLIFLFLLSIHCGAQDWQALVNDQSTPGLELNPDRGLIPGFDGLRNFPYSTEFFYIGLNTTMVAEGTYDWSAFEVALNAIANEGNRAIPRFMLDYPAQAPATPQYLIDAGVQMNSYTEYDNTTSLSPDYSSEYLMTELEAFIAAYGLAYNGDPRIACVQAGTVGFWGEWHNYPLEATLGISEANRLRIFQAYVTAFPDTQINIREPKSGIPTSLLGQVGYNDDSFAQSTLGPLDWHHLPKMNAFGIQDTWMSNMQGGEVFPPLGEDFWNTIPNSVGQDWTSCVENSHSSYILHHAIFDDEVGSTTHNNALIGSAQLGYQFYINAVRINAGSEDGLDVDLRIQNDGVAPFYYDWEVELGLVDENGQLVPQLATNVNLSSLMPGQEVIWNFISTESIAVGEYQLVVHIKSPLSELVPAAKTIRFANATQDEHLDGWLSLGAVSISAGCPADIDGNGVVNVNDFVAFNSAFGSDCDSCAADLDDNGSVDVEDFLAFNSAFGSSCE